MARRAGGRRSRRLLLMQPVVAGARRVDVDLWHLRFVDLYGYRMLRALPALAAEHDARMSSHRPSDAVSRVARLLGDEGRWS